MYVAGNIRYTKTPRLTRLQTTQNASGFVRSSKEDDRWGQCRAARARGERTPVRGAGIDYQGLTAKHGGPSPPTSPSLVLLCLELVERSEVEVRGIGL